MRKKNTNGFAHIGSNTICKNFLQHSKDAVFIVNKKNKVEYASPSCKKIFGYSAKEFINVPCLTEKKILHPSCKIRFEKFWKEYAKNKTFPVKTSEWRWVKKDGKEIYTKNSFVNLSEHGKSVGFLTIAQDITKEKDNVKLTEQLSSLLDSIRKIDQLIVKEKNEDILLQKACEILRETRGYNFVWIGIVNEYERTITPVASSGPKILRSKLKKFIWTKQMESYCHIVQVIKNRKTISLNKLTSPFLDINKLCSWHKGIIQYGDISTIFVPLIRAKLVSAIIVLSSPEPKIFNLHEIKLIKELANNIAFALQSIKIEKTAKENETLYTALVELSPDIVAVHSQGKIVLVNKAAVKSFGAKNKKELIGKPVINFVHPESRADVIKRIKKMTTKHRQAPPIEERFLRLNGTPFDVETSAVPIKYKGKPAIQVVAHDIGARKKSAIALAQESSLAQNIIDLNPYAVALGRSDGYIFRINKAFVQLFGSTPPPDYNIFKDPMLLKSDYKKLFKKMFEGEIVEFPKIWYNAHRLNPRLPDKEICIRSVFFPIKGVNKKVEYVVGMHENITQAAQIDKAKSEFVSLASHQLKTPLTGIKWFTELLMDHTEQQLTKRQSELAKEISIANQRMITLVNALLNVSRIEMGTMKIEPKKINAEELANECVRLLMPRVKKNNQYLTKNFHLTQKFVINDRNLLAMIIQNILANAIQYTKSNGQIKFSLENKQDNLLLTISDTGIGIPLSAQEKIFTKLYRADNAKIFSPNGNGLGLYIVKSVLDYMNGKIWFTSTVGKGTTFYVSIPMKGITRKKGTKNLIMNE
ncbi:PAS domain S-box protein [Candidatus Uhrbacteria bacterium]|nr:PAS domain S-box protein [Candidatus Uhrbacteria bacterium]